VNGAARLDEGLTALVLAGTRPGGDLLARQNGVTHKALLDVGGSSMLARVVGALRAVPQVGRVVIATERADLLQALPTEGKTVSMLQAGAGPSASVALALRALGTPLLVTTADHALLRPEWVQEFLADGAVDADAIVGLARREAVMAAAPGTLRTWLRFADGDYSGCNLFLLRSPAAQGIVALWQELEAARKRPLTLLSRLGPSYVLRYRLGRLTLDAALTRLGQLTDTRIRPAILRDGRAAIDVDKPEDLELARQLVAARSE
jgi:GTP:adenosylcobinamide-phosphate guanylyltransferase